MLNKQTEFRAESLLYLVGQARLGRLIQFNTTDKLKQSATGGGRT